jgi:predicted ATPase
MHKKVGGVIMHFIKIRNLGPIKNCEMEIKKFTVLTGPQAEGKSTIAKAIYYFLRVKEIFREQIMKNKDVSFDGLTNFLRTKLFATFGNSVVNSSSMQLEYFYKSGTWIFITAVEKSDGQIFVDFQFSENFKQLIEENVHSDLIFWDNEKNQNELKVKLEKFFEINFKPIYIPAGRSTIASLTDYISEIFIRSNTMENRMVERNIGSCVTDYVRLILILRGMFFNIEQEHLRDIAMSSDSKIDRNSLTDFVKLSQKILKGKYIFKNGEEFLMTENKNSVYTKMSFASSGQQEIVWVCNIMFFYLYQAVPTFLILEEPEAHLYPSSQKNISDLISLFVNVGNNVLITTHSPYILGEFNNLLFANEIKNSKEEVKNLLKNTRLLPYEDSQAFYIADGVKNEGMEENLICNELIDGASNDINELNDKLLKLKWTMEKE